MVGGRWGRSPVPVYGCSGYAQKGKTFCSHNRIAEAPLVEAIVRLIEKRYLSDAALNRLRQTIRKMATQTQPDRDLDAGTIRQRIKALDKQIVTGTERVFDAPKNLVGTIYTRLDQYKTERDRLQAQLQAIATPARASRLDVEETVEAAIAALSDLRKAIRGSDPENARELFRQIIGSIELSFDRQQVGKYTKSKFREGTIHVRPENVPTCTIGPTVPLW